MNYNRTNLSRLSRVADTLARAPRVGGSRSKWKKKLRKKSLHTARTDDGEKWVIYGDFPRVNYQKRTTTKNTPQLEKRREKKVVRFDIAVESRESSSGERWINMGNFCWLWETNVVRYQMSHGNCAHQRAREIIIKSNTIEPIILWISSGTLQSKKKQTLTYLAHFVCLAVRSACKKNFISVFVVTAHNVSHRLSLYVCWLLLSHLNSCYCLTAHTEVISAVNQDDNDVVLITINTSANKCGLLNFTACAIIALIDLL